MQSRSSIFIFLQFVCLVQQIQTQPSSCVTCINCQDVYDGSDTNSSCSNADSCQKLRIQLPGTIMVAKSCAKTCEEKAILVGFFRIEVNCCTTTNCNRSKRTIFGNIYNNFFIL